MTPEDILALLDKAQAQIDACRDNVNNGDWDKAAARLSIACEHATNAASMSSVLEGRKRVISSQDAQAEVDRALPSIQEEKPIS